MSSQLMPPIKPHRVGAQQPFHSSDKVRLRRFHDQMEMVVHQTPRVDLPARLLACLFECSQESFSISIILENGFSAVAPTHDVIDGPRIFQTQLSWHRMNLYRRWLFVSIVTTDPNGA